MKADRLRLTRLGGVVAAAIAVVIGLAACSSSGTGGGGGGGGPSASPAVIVPVAGCGAAAHTDPTDRSNNRTIARCSSGAPAPQKLSQPHTVVIAGASKGEYSAPVLLGMAKGEFAKENLTVKFVQMPSSDATVQLASGKVDAALAAPYVSFTNGVASGLDLKLTLANYSPQYGGDATKPQSGLWVRRADFADPQKPDLAQLKGKRICNTLGNGTVSVYWMQKAVQAAGISLKDVTWSALQPADCVTALQQGAVSAAYLLDPFWTQIKNQTDKYALAAVQPNEPNGAILYGPNLLEKHRDVGEAFARAYIRTINTYLGPGYHQNATVVNDLAQEIGVEPSAITNGYELKFEWEWRSGILDDIQKTYLELGTQKAAVIPEDKLVDRSFYNQAVGYNGK